MSCWPREEKFHTYKQQCIILFIIMYKSNSPLLKEKLMNENVRIGNPRIKIEKCVGTLKMKTWNDEITTKTNNRPNFQWENNTWARVDMEFLFELNTRREIPYLQTTMYYFCYHINWEEKPTSLMNENKWIDNPRITIIECVGANS